MQLILSLFSGVGLLDIAFKELVNIQGLPFDYDLKSFNVAGKKRAVGNGVPLSMGRVLANAVLSVTDLIENNVTVLQENSVTVQDKICLCGCGRIIFKPRGKYYDFSCRKRAQRKRDRV